MKQYLLIVALLSVIQGQSQVIKRLSDRAKQKLENVAGNKVDNAIDDTVNGTKNEKKETNNENDNDNSSKKNEGVKTSTLKSYSKYDFVPGDKIIYAEDFGQDVLGELPLKWKTNGMGELTTLEGVDGKWLKMTQQNHYTAPFNTKLPDNYTLEFDILVDFKEDQRIPAIAVNLVKPLGSDASGGEIVKRNAGIVLNLKPNGGQSGEPDAVSMDTYDPNGIKFYASNGDQLHSVFNNYNKKSRPVHVAIWVQGTRVRAWLNEQKVYDLPNALPKNIAPNQLSFKIASYGGSLSNYSYFISNIKIASAAPDTRSKLITEGKFSTTGIMFDVNSDKIKPLSNGILKEIAAVLIENSAVKVKIIGHTDNDGDDAKNLDLSKRRAASVKKALAEDFKIDEARMETDGMGATKPVSDNKTSEGKAQNRRVDFVKL